MNSFSRPLRYLLHRLLAASLLTACVLYLASCGNDVAATPTPLASEHLDGNWTLTPNNPSNTGVSAISGYLANAHATGSDTNIAATGTLTVSGSCAEGTPTPITLSGNITNPHDILLVIHLAGSASGATLTIDGQEIDNRNLITGTYTIQGGPCQTDSASFTATRDGTNGNPTINPPGQ